MAGSVPEVRKCEACGCDFLRQPRISSGQWAKRRFCSKKCAGTRSKLSREVMAEMYLSGLSSPEVAAAAGVTPTQARRVLRSYGVEIRDQSEAMKISHRRPEIRERFSVAASGRRHSDATRGKLASAFGDDHPLWRSGITVSSGGYLMFTGSKANGRNAGRLIHRVIGEWAAGRPLEKGEHVHHRDGDKLNNHPDNLQIMSASDHARLHAIKSGLGKKHA